MLFGLYAPVPHVTVGSPEIAASVAGAGLQLPQGAIDPAFEHARSILLEAENVGFDIILFAERHLGADMEAWVLASAISSLTTRIRSMVAVHPGLWHPTLIAKMASTLDRLCRGRMAINLVTGWNVEEHEMFGGDTMLGDDGRYVRAEEFVQVLHGMWTQEKFSFDGRFFQVSNAQLLLKPATSRPPEIFTASRSPRGLDMVATVGDWWFLDYDKSAETTEQVMESLAKSIEDMRVRMGTRGRHVRFAFNPFICLGPSRETAMERAVRLVTPDGSDSDVRKLVERIAPATRAGCVGTPEQVLRQIDRFREIGVELLLFKFPPVVDDVRAVGEHIIAPLRRAFAPAGAALA
ncbi:MAG: LLM class flavin-dependent oxidoreductase [Beijerinckiaceae bacterium]|nr:LLM class flavin-dependent oxidoreductase [Beijerinckiaceae bacterium]